MKDIKGEMKMKSKSEEKKKYRKLPIFLTLIMWIIFGSVLYWHIIVFMWVIFSINNTENIYFPESVSTSLNYILIVIVWIILVTIIGIILRKNNNIQAKKKMHKSERVKYIEREIQWSEAMISNINSQKILKEINTVRENFTVVSNKKSILSNKIYSQPQKLLNVASSLIKQGQIVNGMSYLRIILDHPDSSYMLKNIAKIKLSQCLYQIGYKDIAEGLVENVI